MFRKIIQFLLLTIPVCLALKERIVNGNDAKPGEYPYAVSIHWKPPIIGSERLICGGVILTSDWVLTSAQCIRRIGTVTVKAGKRILSSPDEDEQYRQAGVQIAHGGYIIPTPFTPIPKNDIALLKLRQPLILNPNIQAVRLPASNKNVTGNATVIGWGGDLSSDNSDVLQSAEVPIIQPPYCQDTLRTILSLRNAKVGKNQICSGPIGEKTSACDKDTGGPLVQSQRNSRQVELVGIISWSDSKCGRRGLPTVYTRVSAYVDWINGFIKANY